MWIWRECEDFDSSEGEVEVVDDWGAAAMRCARMTPGSGVGYETWLGPGERWLMSIRYRSASGAAIAMDCRGQSRSVKLTPTGGKQWGWATAPVTTFDRSAASQDRRVRLELTMGQGECDIDGFFLHSEPMELPERVDVLDGMAGHTEAQGIRYQGDLAADMSGCVQPDVKLGDRFLSDIAREAAGKTWPVLESLAGKPCPYIVSAYDIGAGTDYNSDYSWHALDKEKRWELPASGMLGLVNPNSDVYYALGFAVDDGGIVFRPAFRPVLHTVDLLVYEVDLHEDLRCEVAFRCADSSTVTASVHLANDGTGDHRVIAADLFGKDPQDDPPSQRYVLPGQKFGAGVTTTAGSMIWRSWLKCADAACVCFVEWVRRRSRGRRLLLTTRSVHAPGTAAYEPEVEPDFADAAGPATVLTGALPVIVPAGGSAAVAIAFNCRRFTIGDDWNPEVTPHLYRAENEQRAVEAGYQSCVDALSVGLGEAVKQSVARYQTYPQVRLPEKMWEADFYACLELPRASTFSPCGALETPFYNFCRVHAHEPFGWWSYGMHAHENLGTLFTNITDPGLSADFLRGHLRHQRDDGKYPYGVSHTINPRLTTDEATAPLIVWEAWNSYLWSGDRKFLREAFESGKRNHEWWLRTRDRCGEGLCHWLDTCNESVRDDAGLATWQVTGGSQYQEALDLNCYLLMQERTLAAMAAELGCAQEAGTYLEKAERRAELMNAYMWYESDRCYYGIGEVVRGWADVKDISTFMPLWAGLAPKGRFERIVEMIGDPERFGLPYGPPSLAANEPGFGPEQHWQGANWVEMSLFAILGLKRYGYYRLASGLAYANAKMVFDELERFGHFREYFNSMDGSGVDLIDYIWTAIPAWLVVNVFIGIEPKTEHLEVLPALPQGWNEVSVENLHIRRRRVSVAVRADQTVEATRASVNGKPAEVVEGRGARIPWGDLKDGDRVEIVQSESLADVCAVPPEAPTDWSNVRPHAYPDDPGLVERVRSLMRAKDELQ